MLQVLKLETFTGIRLLPESFSCNEALIIEDTLISELLKLRSERISLYKITLPSTFSMKK